MTWPDEVDDGTWKQATEFNYPFVPKKKSGSVNGAADEGGGGAEGGGGLAEGGGDEKDSDWRTYPRDPKNGDLCTMRVEPAADHGWFSCHNQEDNLALSYVWERSSFPWLMTW